MPVSRRTFFKNTSLAAASVAFPAVVKSANPNSKLQVVSVGANGMAFSDIKNIGGHAAVKYVGFCDIDSSRFDKVDDAFPGTPHFADFREMYAQLGDKFDAVSVGTPDHMHAKASIDAMRMKKHVYCQKPLAHTVWESRQMRLEAEKAGVVTQMGNQIHSAIEYRLGTRLLKEGAIGKIKEVFSWVGVTGNERNKRLDPMPGAPVPANVNWDLWIGVAPMRDYAPCYHPFIWRDWQDFGGGAMGDFGCHILDPVFTALGLNAPLTVTARNSGINQHIWPTSEEVEYVFPGSDMTVDKTLKVTWSDGGLRPSRKLAKMPGDLDLPKSGSLFIGEKGNMVLGHVAGPRLYPTENFTTFKYPKEQGLSHWHVWVDACLAGGKTSDGFHYAGPLSEAVQLGNVATRFCTGPIDARTGDPLEPKILEWDAENLRIKNFPEADKLLTKTYRDGWAI
ncbi:Gfo/Idh/MocA family oxidoreductase [Prosthecobacter sp. SYSU 5D2]|uniref:Gfo/Idh/MocA family protein n=1 Tax=Prosthecobacter sp. SYSU 5D2 TaxID=3134134 RepID=UPI0031FEB2B7